VSETWSAAATHVVCAVNENREARRTLKYMQVRSSRLYDTRKAAGFLCMRHNAPRHLGHLSTLPGMLCMMTFAQD
jgi:hypothetical protein